MCECAYYLSGQTVCTLFVCKSVFVCSGLVDVKDHICGLGLVRLVYGVQVWTGTENWPGTLKRRPAHDRVLLLYIYFFALCRSRLTVRSENLPTFPTASPTLVVCIFRVSARFRSGIWFRRYNLRSCKPG